MNHFPISMHFFFLEGCGSVNQSISDDFSVSVDAWHLLNTYTGYKTGNFYSFCCSCVASLLKKLYVASGGGGGVIPINFR